MRGDCDNDDDDDDDDDDDVLTRIDWRDSLGDVNVCVADNIIL